MPTAKTAKPTENDDTIVKTEEHKEDQAAPQQQDTKPEPQTNVHEEAAPQSKPKESSAPPPNDTAPPAAHGMTSYYAPPTLHPTTIATTTPKRKKRQYNIKNPNRPKRPLSAYNVFFKYERERLVRETMLKEEGVDKEKVEELIAIRDLTKSGKRVHRKTHGEFFVFFGGVRCVLFLDAGQRFDHILCTYYKLPSIVLTISSLHTSLSFFTQNTKKSGAIPFESLGKQIATNWKNLSKAERAKYESEASLDKERYAREVEEANALLAAQEEEMKKQQEQFEQNVVGPKIRNKRLGADGRMGAPDAKRRYYEGYDPSGGGGRESYPGPSPRVGGPPPYYDPYFGYGRPPPPPPAGGGGEGPYGPPPPMGTFYEIMKDVILYAWI